MRSRPIVTIDGPAGAGKSTIGRALANWLSFTYLDTGALYRAVAYGLTRKGVAEQREELTAFFRSLDLKIRNRAGNLHVFLDDEDVTTKIRTEEIGLLASRISAIPQVREALLSVQRDIAKEGGVVAEGRDMGTVVFPDAEIKFFLDASEQARVGRRYQELLDKGEGVSLTNVEKDLLLRDRMDRERPVAPLTVPPDATRIDSTDKTISEVVEVMKGVITQRGNGPM